MTDLDLMGSKLSAAEDGLELLLNNVEDDDPLTAKVRAIWELINSTRIDIRLMMDEENAA
jgi:hypothetical protein